MERSAPAGSWIVYRPSENKKVVHVGVVDERRPGVVVRLRVYDAQRGTLISDAGPRTPGRASAYRQKG